MKTKMIKAMGRVLGAVAGGIFLAWFIVAQPSCRSNHASGTRVDPVKLKAHVEALSYRFFPRDWQHRENLDHCAEYIAGHFKQAGADVEFQEFTVGKNQYRNVIGRFNAGRGPRVIVGAHYDSCGEEPGAEEEIHGEPFVGPAGELLTKMIQAMGLKRAEIYIGNIMNWRPW